MNNRLTFFLNGIEVNPKNREDFNIDFSFGNLTIEGQFLFSPSANIQQNSLVLNYPPDMKIITDWIGLQRIYEGIPFKVFDNNTQKFIFNEGDACCEINNSEFSYSIYEIKIPIIEKRQLFEKQATNLHFKLLFEKKILKTSDFIDVNYIIESPGNSQEQAFKLFTLTNQAVQMSMIFYKQAKELLNIALDAGHTPITSQAISAAKLINQSIEFAFTTIALYQSLTALTDYIFDKIRYHKSIRFKKAFERCCEYFGLKFKSSIFDQILEQNMTYCAPKFGSGAKLGENPTDDGVPNLFFSDFLEIAAKMFNAKAILKNDTLIFERIDYFLANPNGIVLDYYRNENNEDLPINYNSHELPCNILFKFERDYSDLNTAYGADYAAQIHDDYLDPVNKKFVNSKGLMTIDTNVSKGYRKNSSNVLEDIFNTILDIFDWLFNDRPYLAGDRIGCLKLSDHSFNIGKVFLCDDNGYLLEQNDSFLSAKKFITENYVPFSTQLTNQQIIIKEPMLYPLNNDQIQKFIENPICQDVDGNKLMVVGCQYVNNSDLYALDIRYLGQKYITTKISEKITTD